jgi:hypothetical protein
VNGARLPFGDPPGIWDAADSPRVDSAASRSESLFGGVSVVSRQQAGGSNRKQYDLLQKIRESEGRERSDRTVRLLHRIRADRCERDDVSRTPAARYVAPLQTPQVEPSVTGQRLCPDGWAMMSKVMDVRYVL